MVVTTMEGRLLQATISPHSGSRVLLSPMRHPRSRKEFAGQTPSLTKTAGLQVVVQAKLAGKPATVPLEDQLSNSEDLAKWQAARAPLLGFAVSEQEANQVLAKSFGWFPSPYWGEERAKTMPDPALVQKTLDFLCSLGLSDADLPAFLKKFPEVLGCLLEEEMQKNVQILEKEWGISGTSLRNLLLRNPKVLGYNVDCKGDCMAQCTRCWVRF
ncbi:hypothetical protein GOP47_0013716 [Adiantum capillus-veneris]|uniref:Mitochondrial transcription termination factor family protein n=1 Tax=Adiantum capillus-veneris TaxID=13818 RepID=A0A9D4UPA3_ADICA|nr:hypothetical protein GOP47_0013716 [Adiantum capillus-veneris]